MLDPKLVRRIMDGARGLKYLMHGLMLPAVRDMHGDLTTATTGADLLVANELVYAASPLAEQTGLRWVSYSLAPISYFSSHDPCIPPDAAAVCARVQLVGLAAVAALGAPGAQTAP